MDRLGNESIDIQFNEYHGDNLKCPDFHFKEYFAN